MKKNFYRNAAGFAKEIASIATFHRNDKNLTQELQHVSSRETKQKLKSLANAMRRSMKRDLERGFADEGMEKVMPYMTFGYLILL